MLMDAVWKRITRAMDRLAPDGSQKRKFLQIVGVILLLEGFATTVLSSKFAAVWGIPPVILGALLLMLFPPRMAKAGAVKHAPRESHVPDTYGIRFVDFVMNKIGNDYIVMALGAAVIGFIVLYNGFVSAESDYGDLDTLSFMFGGMLIVYPFAVKRFKVEVIFALLFITFVVLMLVVPQALMSVSDDDGSSAGNWYVHYMLAAPFAGSLNLMGIHAHSFEEFITITFRDGSVNTLGISTACAGLYSFSIFVSAFLAFTLVFERLPPRLMALVLGIGVLAAYLGNLFRMIVIGVVGYYNGMDALLWAHKNVGWMVFLGWSALFWYLVIRYADRRAHSAGERSKSNAS